MLKGTNVVKIKT